MNEKFRMIGLAVVFVLVIVSAVLLLVELITSH